MKTPNSSQFTFTSSRIYDDDDDFQNPIQSLPQTQTQRKPSSSQKLKPSVNRPSKKPKKTHSFPGKENLINPPDFDLSLESIEPIGDGVSVTHDEKKMKLKDGFGYLSNSIESRLLLRSTDGCSLSVPENACEKADENAEDRYGVSVTHGEKKTKCNDGFGYLSNSIESRLLLRSRGGCCLGVCENACEKVDEDEERFEDHQEAGSGSTQLDVLLDLCCSSEENEIETGDNVGVGDFISCPMCGTDISNMSDEMRQVHTNECLDKEQIDIPNSDHVLESSGQVLDDPPCLAPGQMHHVSPISAWLQNLGLSRYEEVFICEEIDWDSLKWLTDEVGITALGPRKKIVHAISELRTQCHEEVNVPEKLAQKETKTVTNKLITDFFPGYAGKVRKSCTTGAQAQVGKTNSNNDYGGLTKSFCHGKIYCSLITAKLVNLKIGIPWEKIEVLPLNQKTNIAGVDVTCFDANHCPGAIIILFEPPNGKAILHTGDFRFTEDMTKISSLQTRLHTLVLDTTYCDPQYDFPKQEAVIQYVLEAIQAEAFNPKTLFLIGSYTIEDMQWLTLDERESHIHVVPMWTLANLKRLKHVSNMYMGRYSLIVAFSPTGWSFSKGKKSSPGKRWQQGTVIRYEVPYSEHSSFTELQKFVKFISPENIIPSVNNYGPESVSKMVSLLSS
ncbi:hypothetical protein L1987_14426 [Smallanthus sonchifolius]|uniref:Uncharacterized protein n=1 Tax=Smallanthus sonchifolius TaxID=185202 RepID=A0ACB9J692_9ASTR|nr:hypothetical protein L1987_14426 [Smallanthus sonchifolius]